jgi:polysaccharide pyruvyl transferase WcaK-like protein
MLAALSKSFLARSLEVATRTLPSFGHTTLVLAPASEGSLGDQAILQGLQDGLGSKGKPQQISQLLLDNYRPIGLRSEASPSIAMSSSPNRGRAALSMAAWSHQQLVVAGADVMDGHYGNQGVIRRCEILNQWVSNGRRSTVAGFSFNASPTAEAVEALASLHPDVRILARDPVSHERLQARGIRADLAADLAFLMVPSIGDTQHRETIGFLEAQAAEGRRILGVNVHGPYFFADHERRSREVSASISAFLSDHGDWSACLVPHDYRGETSDLAALEDIQGKLAPSVRSRVHLVRSRLDAWEAKWIAQRLSLAISGRMHFVIACLGAGVPALGANYQGKFEGLYRHCGVSSLLMDEQCWSAKSQVLSAVGDAVARLDDLGQALSIHLPRVKDLAALNLG